MAVTPSQIDYWSESIAGLYNSLEGEIVRIIAKRLKKGHKNITYWQALKLQELRMFNSEVTQELARVTKVAEPEIRQMFQAAGQSSVKDIDKAIPFPARPMPNNLDTGRTPCGCVG